jgi:tRNA (guanine37-N1)-methyltransferase
LHRILPTSFDIIGDIILIKLPKELHSFSKEIGNALLKTHAHAKTVCSINPVSGEFRNRYVQVIAGEHKTVTMHKEYGTWLRIDVEKTYFSPRLANERKRVSSLIRKKSCVLDMFCGVAPFPILIAKYAEPIHIIAVDKNPIAIELAEFNIRKNNVKDKISLFKKDARDAKQLCYDLSMQPDHIIMNLPFSAFSFFPIAVQLVSNNGMIHYYDILNESQFEQRINNLIETANNYRRDLIHLDLHKIKTYAPHEFYIGIDITVSKK